MSRLRAGVEKLTAKSRMRRITIGKSSEYETFPAQQILINPMVSILPQL